MSVGAMTHLRTFCLLVSPLVLFLPGVALAAGTAPVRYDVLPEPSGHARYEIMIHEPNGNEGMDTDYVGEIVGPYKFLVVRLPHNRAEIVLYRHGLLLYRIADQPVEASGRWFPPGWTAKGYNFYFSPDGRYLFVQRGLVNDTCVGYLYHRVGRKWRPVRSNGMRLDWNALCYYSARHRLDASKLGSRTFVTHFERWIWTRRVHALVFSTGAASICELRMPHKGDLVAAYDITFNLRTGRFSNIVNKTM